MSTGVITALIAAFAALVVAGVSEWSSRNSAREVQELRDASKESERLRGATGALQLKLFLYTRSVVRRSRFYYIHPYPVHAEQRELQDSAYHDGGLFIHRLLRPLTVSDIIEQEIFYEDLLLKPAILDLLRFNHAALEMLTGERLGEGFPKSELFPEFDMKRCGDSPVSWPQRDSGEPVPSFQRVRASYLRTAAAALVVTADKGAPRRRCMAEAEFLHAWEHPAECGEFHAALVPVKALIDGFSPKCDAVLWLRLVGYAYVCRWFQGRVCDALARGHVDVEYTAPELPVSDMLKAADGSSQAAQGSYLAMHADAYEDRFKRIIHDAF